MEVDKKLLYVLTLVTIVLHRTGAQADGAQADGAQTDVISGFKCNALGQMDMAVPSWVEGVTVQCTPPSNSTAKPVATILANQNVTIKNCEKDIPASLIMYGLHPTPSSTPSIISSAQKSAQVSLKCASKPGSNWTETITFPIIGPTLPGVSATETIGKLSTKLLENNDSFSTATEVTLGGSYILVISGEEPYFKKVQSCKASKTGNNFDAGTEVFNNTVTDLDKTTITQLKNSTNRLLPHDTFLSMTGFRLVGSTTVYLQCSVAVCKSDCATQVTKRKRSTTPSKVRYATVKFEVKDKVLNPLSSGIKGIHSMTSSFVLLFIVTVLRYQTI